MRRMASFMLAALAGVAAYGQGLLDCVEPDVLRALLLQSQGEPAPVITGEVPAELSALEMPAGFGWIGSSQRVPGSMFGNISLVTAAWRSDLAPEAARTAATAAMAASGWEVRPAMGMGMMVFRASATQVTQTACRNGNQVSLNVSAMDGTTYVLLNLTRGNNPNNACSQPAGVPFNPRAGLEPDLPRLEMPADPATGQPALMSSSGGGGGSDDRYNARADFTLADSVGNVARHFARQLAGQGWTSDADWTGRSTAGSTWSKRQDADTLLQGTLSVTAIGERQFVATFRLAPLQ